MLSKMSRLAVGLSLFMGCGTAHASTWAPTFLPIGVIVIPLPSLDGATSEPVYYGTSATLTLDGFGATSSIYYRVKHFQNGSWQVPATWSCKNEATLTASNQLLTLQDLSFGHYQVDVIPVMAKKQCDLTAFAAQQLIAGKMVTSNEFELYNTAPVANVDTINSAEDTAVNIDVLANDTDTDNQTLSVTSVSAGYGNVSVNADQTLTYTPNADFYGADTINYTIIDGFGGTASSTVAVTVTAINDAPIANAQTVSLDEDTALSITLSASDTESSSLVYSIVSNPVNGVLSGSGVNQTYTPYPNFNDTDSFTFRAYDNTSYSDIVTVSITVNPVNDIPVVQWVYTQTNEDTAIEFSFSGTDVDGDELTYTLLSIMNNGTLSGTGANRTYQPNLNFSGSDSFYYAANDGTTDSLGAAVSITVNPVNDAPTAENNSIQGYEDTPQSMYLRANDPEGSPLTYRIVTHPSHGTLSGSGSHPTYTPDSNYNNDYYSMDEFTYVVNDGTSDSAIASVQVTVEPINDQPIAESIDTSTSEGIAVVITLAAIDQENDTLTYAITSNPSNGALELVDGSVNQYTYTPSTNFSGNDSFVYTVDDGGTAQGDDVHPFPDVSTSSPATVNIQVENVNNAPEADSDSIDTPEDTAVQITLSGSDVDTETNIDNLIYIIQTPPTHGTLTATNNARIFTYTPNENYYGTDLFTFKTNDGSLDSQSAAVNITINRVNDVPQGIYQQVATREDNSTGITLSGADVETTGLVYVIHTLPADGVIDINGTEVTTVPSGVFDGTGITYTPNNNFNGNDSFTFTASDTVLVSAPETVDIIVVGENDAPVTFNQNLTIDEDTSIVITFTGSDEENAPLEYLILTNPANGTLSGTDDTRTYTPNQDYNGTDSFSFNASDGTTDSAVATVTLTVRPVNDQPLAIVGNTSIGEDNTGIDVTLSGTDVDGDTLTYTVTSEPTKGTLSGTGAARHYIPNANANGVDSFSFKVNDGTVDSAVQTYTINITPINDLPVVTVQSLDIEEDSGAVTIDLTAVDPDEDTWTYIITSDPTHGTLSGTGAIKQYTPTNNANGTDSFSYKVNDGTADSATVAVTIEISPVNDLPVANTQNVTIIEDSAAFAISLTADDADGDTLTYSIVTPPNKGTLSGVGETQNYQPHANANGNDSFSYRVFDGIGYSSNIMVNITITPVNDAPVITSTTGTTSVSVDTLYNYQLIVEDVDSSAFTYQLTTAPQGMTINGAGLIGWQPIAAQDGDHEVVVQVSDGETPTNQTFTLTVMAMGAPTLSRISTPKMLEYSLQWTAFAAATRYELQEQKNGGTWTQIYDGVSASMLFTQPVIADYDYKVRACNATLCSEWSPILPAMRLKNTYTANDTLGTPILRSDSNKVTEKTKHSYPYGQQEDKQ